MTRVVDSHKGEFVPSRTVVDAFVRYPANSVVDLNLVTSKLVANKTDAVKTKDPRSVTRVVSLQIASITTVRTSPLFYTYYIDRTEAEERRLVLGAGRPLPGHRRDSCHHPGLLLLSGMLLLQSGVWRNHSNLRMLC